MAQEVDAVVSSAIVRPAAEAPRKPWWVLPLVMVGAAALLYHQPMERTAYSLVRQIQIDAVHIRVARWPYLQNKALRVYYPRGQKAEAQLVLNVETRALPIEEKNLGEYPKRQLSIVLYSSQAAMNRAVGLAPQANNIGYDYQGVMDILSPSAWLGVSRADFQTFLTQGPAPHELGHALLNLKADMNYPDWFNEGVAQYEDYKVTGYQWITSSNSLNGPLYSMNQLNHQFYQLPNQSRAYREGLALVEYLETVHGHKAFARFLGDLAAGVSFSDALQSTYHLPSTNALFSAWHEAHHS